MNELPCDDATSSEQSSPTADFLVMIAVVQDSVSPLCSGALLECRPMCFDANSRTAIIQFSDVDIGTRPETERARMDTEAVNVKVQVQNSCRIRLISRLRSEVVRSGVVEKGAAIRQKPRKMNRRSPTRDIGISSRLDRS